MKKRTKLIMCVLLIIILAVIIILVSRSAVCAPEGNGYDIVMPTGTPAETPENGNGNETEFEENTEEPEIVKELPKIDRVIDFEQLQSKNDEIYAWLYIPDTKINYPILQSKTDNGFYLNHDSDKNSSIAGSIYTENRNSMEYTDYNTLIYGHNMKNGIMFTDTLKYSDEDFFESHRDVYIYTAERAYKYKIFAAYVNDDNHILVANNFSTEEGFQNYLDKILALTEGVFDKTMEITTDDRIITLSTCNSSGSQRVLTQAVLEVVYEYEEMDRE